MRQTLQKRIHPDRWVRRFFAVSPVGDLGKKFRFFSAAAHFSGAGRRLSGAIAADVTVVTTRHLLPPLRGCGFAAGGRGAERLGCIRFLPARRASEGPPADREQTGPTRRRGRWPRTLAGASGSTRQTTTVVTPSPHAIVSTQALLELARWCQQHLARMEEQHRCHDADSNRQSPPASAVANPLPDDSSLARVDATTPDRPADPVDCTAAPTRPRRSTRNGGGR